jgi:hypothetical protein
VDFLKQLVGFIVLDIANCTCELITPVVWSSVGDEMNI